MTYRRQKIIIINLFLIIPLTLLFVFTFFPTLLMSILSLFQWSGTDDMVFVGLNNYTSIFSSQDVFRPLFNSIYYFIGAMMQMTFALFLAMLLSFNLKFKNFYKGVIFFPYLMNGIAVGLIFTFFFKEDGVLNYILMLLGNNQATDWLRTYILNNILLAGVSVWKYMGFNLVMFIGAIQSISNDQIEAARIDGASQFKLFRFIIFPSIKNVVLLNLILSIKGAVSVFELPYIMTGGEWNTSTFMIKTIQLGISGRFLQIGLASAMSFVLFTLIILVTVIQHFLFKEKEEKNIERTTFKLRSNNKVSKNV
jgi:ABC-type sugar transport system permease subunit